MVPDSALDLTGYGPADFIEYLPPVREWPPYRADLARYVCDAFHWDAIGITQPD